MAAAVFGAGYFYWRKTSSISSDILSPASQKISVSLAPKSPDEAILAPAPSSGPHPASSPTPRSVIALWQPVKASSPSGKIVFAKEETMPKAGFIIEEIQPQSQKIPPLIIEEKSPDAAVLPSPSPPFSPSPTPSPLPTISMSPAGEGDGLAQSEEESPSSVSTSTPAVSPSGTIYLSEYALTARYFNINWQSSSTDISFYNIQQKQNSGDWQNWINATTSTSTVFVVPQDLTIYYFRVQATDSQNATSTWAETAAPINFYPIVINEIAWAGTGTSSKAAADEWIELYNKTNLSVDITNWQLISSDEKGPTITFSTSTAATTAISANGFYLLERTDDSATSESADWTGAFGNGLGNNPNCEILSLYDQNNNLVDKTFCLENNHWPAGTASPDYKSMERVNPYLAADIPGNWQSNSTSTRNGLNIDGQPINGTPKAQNSVFNPNFFYLYSAQNITATSTILKWAPFYINNFKEYKVIRFFDATSSAPIIIAIATSTDFFDETLESEADYYYQILACDNLDNCVASNIIQVKTPEFPFWWAEPQILAEVSTSSPAQLFDIALDPNNQPIIIWLDISSSTPDISSSSDDLISPITVLNIKGEPYVFWVGTSSTSSSIYFNFLGENQRWRTPKKVFELPYMIKMLRVIVDSNNSAYLAWLVESENKIYYTFSKIE